MLTENTGLLYEDQHQCVKLESYMKICQVQGWLFMLIAGET